MQSPFRRFENLFRLLTTLTLTLCALNFLLIPEKFEAITKGMPIIVSLLFGISLYEIGLVNQASIFIQRNNRIQKFIQMLVVLCLGALGFIYLQANLILECIILVVFVCIQLYLMLFQENEYNFEKYIFLLGHALLSFINGGILLSGAVIFSRYEFSPLMMNFLGWLFVLGSGTGFAAFYLHQKKKNVSQILFRLTAIPWLAWIAILLFVSEYNTIPVILSIAILPLITNLVAWDELHLPQNDYIGHKIVQTASLAEFLILFSFVGIGLRAQNLAYAYETLLKSSSMLANQDFSYAAMLVAKGFTFYVLIAVVPTIKLLSARLSSDEFAKEEYEKSSYKGWSQWIARSLKSLALPSQSLRTRVDIQAEQIAALTYQLGHEKKRTTQLNLLAELSHQLEAQLDQPVSAQLAVNTLQRALNCKHVAIFENEIERREFSIMSSAGTYLPSGYRQSTSKGILGRTLRLRKTQIANVTEKDPDFINPDTEQLGSAFTVPLIYHGHVKAILEAGDDRVNAFSSHDVHLAEMVATELIRAWERSSYHQRLTNLIKAGISLSPLLESQTTIKEIATIAREILQARFTFVTLIDQENNLSRTAHSGHAPRLLNSLNHNPIKDSMIQVALNAHEAFRIRDIRKYRKASHIEIDHTGLRSLLATPIRLHRLSIGVILAFGKQGEIFFSENDESLISLLSSQSATAIEATWLYQELRTTLSTTTQLFNLSVKIIKAEGVQQAAEHIVETAVKVASASAAGILLFTKDQEIEAGIMVDQSGSQSGQQHPMDLIQQTLESGQIVHMTPDQIAATICFPLQTPLRKYGALWLDVPKIQDYFAHHASTMQTFANQAILALERSILLIESQQQAQEIEAAYEELEQTYDRTLLALMSALDARDRETEGHSSRVSELACLLGAEMGLSASALKALERGSLLHDIGKIGISDTILHKPVQLSEEEWKIMRLHPDIGARIVEDIPFLQDTLPIIRYHQERWNGSGYPVGLSGKDIPIQARIFSVADAFDALISDRPYRERIPVSEAMDYMKGQAGLLFDPEVVVAFEKMWEENELDEQE